MVQFLAFKFIKVNLEKKDWNRKYYKVLPIYGKKRKKKMKKNN
jgi:hypothetical protein